MRPQELNLMFIFDSIMTEKSITRAAERLSMTQPAVSNSVSKMRTLWKDDLFVKDGRNIQPTSYAKNLWEQIREPLHNLNSAIEPDNFDPLTAKRTFRIAVSDIVVDTLWLEMRRFFEKNAPGINLHAVPYTIENTEKLLEDAEVDLVFSGSFNAGDSIRSSHLLDICFICAMRSDHPLAHTPLSLESFANADHLLVSLSGDSNGTVDQALLQVDLTRRVAFTVNHFSAAAPILMESDLIATLPAGAICKHVESGKLAVSTPPLNIPQTSLSLLWHKRQDKDAGLSWLRKHVSEIFVVRWQENLHLVYNQICPEIKNS